VTAGPSDAPPVQSTRSTVLGLDRGLVVFLGLFFLVGMAAAPIRSLLPVYVERELHQPPTLTSTVLGAQLLVGGLFALLGGAVADGVGQRRALLLGLAGLPLAALVFLANQPGVMALLVGLRGATEGLQVAGSQAYLVAGAPAGQIGLASALYFLGGTLGSSLGSLFGGWVVDRLGFGALAYWTVGLGIALTLVAWRFLGEPERTSARRGVAFGLQGYVGLVGRREVILVGAIRFLPTVYWGVMTLLMPLLIYRLSGQVLVASLYSAVSLLLAAASQLATGRAVDRLSRTLPTVLLTALVPPCAVLAAVSSHSLPSLFAVGVVGTCVAWSISATLPPLVREVAGPAEEGRVLGFLHLLWCSAMFGGTMLGGALVDLDPALPFLVVGALNAVTWLAALALHRRARGSVRPSPG
jgi:MFS family permease